MGIFKEFPYNDIIQQIIDRVNCNYKVFSKSCTIEQVNEIYIEEFEIMATTIPLALDGGLR